MKVLKALLLAGAISVAGFAQQKDQEQYPSNQVISGQTYTFYDRAGSGTITLEYAISGASAVSVSVQGCSVGGTCVTLTPVTGTNPYTGTASTQVQFLGGYANYKVTPTFTGGSIGLYKVGIQAKLSTGGGGGGGATIPATTSVLKGDGAGNGAAAIPGTDYVTPSGVIATFASPPPIGFTAPNIQRVAADNNSTQNFTQWFTSTGAAGTGIQPGSTGISAGQNCTGYWTVVTGTTVRATAFCANNTSGATIYTSTATTFGSESWTMIMTIGNAGDLTISGSTGQFIGRSVALASAASPRANFAQVDYSSGARLRGGGTSSTTYGASTLLSETSTGVAGASESCNGSTATGTCASNVPQSAPQFISTPETITFSATPTFSAVIGTTRLVLTGNVTSSTLAAGTDGAQKTFQLCQDATGSRTFTWPTTVKGGMTISPSASTCSLQTFTYSTASGYAFWYATSLGVTGL